MRGLLFIPFIVVIVGCDTTTATTTITDSEDHEDHEAHEAHEDHEVSAVEPVETTARASASKSSTDESARTCSTVASREACVTCCDFSNATSGDILACIAGARCETKPPKTPAVDDCRTSGCGEGTRCEACWTRWVCVGEGVHC